MMEWWEDLLIAILGGGIADLDMLKDAECDWEDVVQELKDNMDFDFNSLVLSLFNVGLSKLDDTIEAKWSELDKDNKEDAKIMKKLDELNVYEDFEYYFNYLDTHLTLVKNNDIYREYLSEAIEELENYTGFYVE